MKKKFLHLLLVLIILPCCFLCSACLQSEKSYVYVTKIEKSDDDYYTVTYSNGQTSTIQSNNDVHITEIEKTNDGYYLVSYSDGSTSTIETEQDKIESQTVEDLFNYAVSKGYCENTEEGYKIFLKDFLNIALENEPEVTKTTSIVANKNKALQSVVQIYAEYNSGANSYSTGIGSGVIYKMEDEYSYIVTNHHVVTENNSVAETIVAYTYHSNVLLSENSITKKVTFGGDTIDCEHIGSAAAYDIAVLKVKTSDLLKYNPTARASDIASKYYTGQTVFAVGCPDGTENIVVTEGTISSDYYYLTNSTTGVSLHELVTDTAVNPGNSGGGLFNENAELVGIVNAKSTWSGSIASDNTGYALPVDGITKVADNIMYNYFQAGVAVGVKRISLGITVYKSDSSQVYDEETGNIEVEDYAKIMDEPDENTIILYDYVKIGDVSSGNTIANTLGLKVDDILTAIIINGTTYELNRYYKLPNYLLDLRAGDTFALLYSRYNEQTEQWVQNNRTINYTVAESDLNVIS